MKARIDVKKENAKVVRDVVESGLFSKKLTQQVSTSIKYVVYLTPELTEEEKAIINENKLGEFLIDKEPWKPEDLANAEARLTVEKNEFMKASIRSEIDRYQNTQRDVSINEFLSPMTRTFDTIAQANKYSAILKSDILPRVAATINAHRYSGDTSELLEF